MAEYFISPVKNADVSNASEITGSHFQSVLVGKYAFQGSEDRLEQGTLFDQGVDALGVSSLRFPGGTEAWNGSFDFRNPDDVAKLHEVIDYCANQNIGLQFTVPVRWFLSSSLDSYGQRVVEISDEDALALASFIQTDLLEYAAHAGVDVENIKLGNEFLAGTDGADFGMNLSSISPEEYGSAAGAVAIIVGEAIEAFQNSSPLAPFYTVPDVVLELPPWIGGIDRMLGNFDTEASKYVNAIDTHGTHLSLGATYDELLGTDASDATWRDNVSVSDSYETLISHMDEASSNYGFGTLTYLNEAWAVDSASLDHLGLAVLTFHSMSLSGIESATLWTAFSGGGFTSTSAAYTDDNGGRMRVLGELFTQMESHLKGMKAVELDTGMTGAEELEQDYIVRAFTDDGRAVIYIMNPQDDQDEIDVNLSELLASMSGFENGISDLEVVKIGATNGAFGSFYKSADVEIYDSETLGLDATIDGITLGAYEVLQITLTGSGEFGTEGADNIVTGAEDDWIISYDGNDVIDTGSGSDRIDAGAGDDTINSGGQSDIIDAGDGDDIVTGGYGCDVVELGNGSDVFYDEINQINKWGADTVYGGDGNDFIYGGGGNDTFFGGNGNDYIEGGTQDDKIEGNAGNDYINGGSGADYLLGGDGDDEILGGSQSDTILGGAGNDVVTGGNGMDIVYLDAGDDVYYDNSQTGKYGRDTVYGGDGNDFIYGGGGNDTFVGGDGNDYIEGGDGNDKILGGSQSDTILGGAGNDVVTGGNGMDIVYLDAGDDVYYDNSQTGKYGRDTVYGGDGNDTIHLGGGNDTVSGGSGADVFVFKGEFDNDHITDFSADEGDIIDISYYNLSGKSDLYFMQDENGSTVIVVPGAGSMILDGFSMDNLTDDVFLF